MLERVLKTYVLKLYTALVFPYIFGLYGRVQTIRHNHRFPLSPCLNDVLLSPLCVVGDLRVE